MTTTRTTEEFDDSEAEVGVSRVQSDTVGLSALARSFEDVQQSRKRAEQRQDHLLAGQLKAIEVDISKRLAKTLKSHALWPWLEPLAGLRTARAARVIAAIGDPWRFPGQMCTERHYFPPVLEVGSRCPAEPAEGEDDGESADGEGSLGTGTDVRGASVDGDGVRCPGIIQPARETSGVRSLYHYAGLHVVDGRLPKRRKGVQSDWKSELRVLLIGPDGIADQIVRHRPDDDGACVTCSSSKRRITCGTLRYRAIYDEFRARRPEPRDHFVARTRAAKEWLKDLLLAWKDATPNPADRTRDSGRGPGGVGVAESEAA